MHNCFACASEDPGRCTGTHAPNAARSRHAAPGLTAYDETIVGLVSHYNNDHAAAGVGSAFGTKVGSAQSSRGNHLQQGHMLPMIKATLWHALPTIIICCGCRCMLHCPNVRRDLPYQQGSVLQPCADILALVGDIGSPYGGNSLEQFLSWCSDRWRHVLYVPGEPQACPMCTCMWVPAHALTTARQAHAGHSMCSEQLRCCNSV